MPIAAVVETGTVLEPVNAELDTAVCARPDDISTWLVYADWLEERSDPRAELIRLQCRSVWYQEEVDEVVAEYWARWFGDTPWEIPRCEWEHGFVHRLELGPLPSGLDSYRALFTCRSVRFLHGLAIARPPRSFSSLEELELMPLLRELRITIPLSQGRDPFPAPTPSDAAMPELIAALLRDPLLERLKALELKTLSPADAQVLLTRPEPFRRVGAGLILGGTESTLDAHRDALRSAFPAARLFAIPPTTPDFRYHCGGPSAHAVPLLAPANFRELAPWAKLPKPPKDEDAVHVGSGVPFTEANGLSWNFSRCMTCASTDTLCIYSSYRHIAGSSEGYTFKSCEYLCLECGLFSSYENSRES